MKRVVCLSTFIFLLAATAAEAQYGRFGPRPRRYRQEREEYFKPVLLVSLGYGFPNLDKYELPDFYHADRGTATQTGPFTGSVDYQFSRRMSIGGQGHFYHRRSEYRTFPSVSQDTPEVQAYLGWRF